jgi:hypothetical protein
MSSVVWVFPSCLDVALELSGKHPPGEGPVAAAAIAAVSARLPFATAVKVGMQVHAQAKHLYRRALLHPGVTGEPVPLTKGNTLVVSWPGARWC